MLIIKSQVDYTDILNHQCDVWLRICHCVKLCISYVIVTPEGMSFGYFSEHFHLHTFSSDSYSHCLLLFGVFFLLLF